jgi:hypothetical protein
MFYRRGAAEPAPRDSVTPAGRPTSDVKPSEAGRFAGQIDSAQLPPKPGGSGVASVSGTVPTKADVTKQLDSLEQIVDRITVTPNEAGQVLHALSRMTSSISANEQRVQAALVEALARSTLQDSGAACQALRRVQPIAERSNSKSARRVKFTLGQSC